MQAALLDASNKRSEITTLNPFLAVSWGTLTPSFTDLSDDLSWPSSYNRTRWDDHMRRDDSVRQDLAAILNDAERRKHTVGTNVYIG